MPDRWARRSIVVGVDGSDASLAALRWAAQQARALHADVVAIHVWQPVEQWLAPYASALQMPKPHEQRAGAERLLESAVRSVFGTRPGVRVYPVLVKGSPVPELLRQARGALLLVIGHHSRGEAALPALGAVGRGCLRQTVVPVVAVPDENRPAAVPATVGSAAASTGITAAVTPTADAAAGRG